MWRHGLRLLLEHAHWHLLPATCLLCGGSALPPLDLCAPCRTALPGIDHPCRGCALPLAAPSESELCGRCLRRRGPLHEVRARCLYLDPADLLVQDLKFAGQVAAARVMATLMLETLPDDLAEAALLPVPLHPRRRWRRGFDQAQLIAGHLARATGRPLLAAAARRQRATAAQSGLDRRARRRNLAGAFGIRSAPLPAHLVLVDDVLTSGATLEALARACRSAGARRVDAWVFARTPPGRRRG